MTYKIAFQMDPMEGVDINADTTFALAEVAAGRDMQLWEYGTEHLSYNAGRIEAFARPMKVRRELGNHVTFGDRQLINLERDIDVVWMRQDPPFDMAYITAAHILERLKGLEMAERVCSVLKKMIAIIQACLKCSWKARVNLSSRKRSSKTFQRATSVSSLLTERRWARLTVSRKKVKRGLICMWAGKLCRLSSRIPIW